MKFDTALDVAGVEIGAGPNDSFVLTKSCNNPRNAGVTPEIALAAALLNLWPNRLAQILRETNDEGDR